MFDATKVIQNSDAQNSAVCSIMICHITFLKTTKALFGDKSKEGFANFNAPRQENATYPAFLYYQSG
jgi:hypothetical protein